MSITASEVDLKAGELVAIRQAFGPTFAELAASDPRLVAVTADLGGSVNLATWGHDNPKRYFNCGVAECDMIGIAAGLAMTGWLPFAITFGSFLGRAMDHVRQSIGHNRLKVNVVGSHGGISNGKDGPSREPTPVVYKESPAFEIGKANVLAEGSDVTLLACGPHVAYCSLWLDAWSTDVSVELIDCHTVKPLDEQTILRSAEKTGRVVTVEDHYISGGLGSAVAELLSEHRPTVLRRVGLRSYATSGPYYELLDHVGIGEDAVRAAVEDALKQS